MRVARTADVTCAYDAVMRHAGPSLLNTYSKSLHLSGSLAGDWSAGAGRKKTLEALDGEGRRSLSKRLSSEYARPRSERSTVHSMDRKDKKDKKKKKKEKRKKTRKKNERMVCNANYGNGRVG